MANRNKDAESAKHSSSKTHIPQGRRKHPRSRMTRPTGLLVPVEVEQNFIVLAFLLGSNVEWGGHSLPRKEVENER
jgi:hypothetical protein